MLQNNQIRFDRIYGNLKTDLKVVVGNLDSCSITHDLSVSVTIRFINDSWEMKNLVLETRNIEVAHTAESIAESLVACQREWGFAHPISVSDNAGAEIKAFKILKWPQFSCIGHFLDLAVSVFLKANQA